MEDVSGEGVYEDHRRWAAVGLALVQGRSLGLLVWKGGAFSSPYRELSHG